MKQSLIIFLIFFSLFCRSQADTLESTSGSIPSLDDILSKKYCLEFSVFESSFDDSLTNTKQFQGDIIRKDNYIFSESDSGVNIFEDGRIFLLRSDLRLITIGPRRKYNSAFLVPFYDPYEIFNFAQRTGSLNKFLSEGLVIYNFQFNLDSFHIYHAAFSFDTTSGQKSLVKIELVYDRLGVKVSDVIQYRAVDSFQPKYYNHIKDYLDIKGPKFELKSEFLKYWLVNLY